MVDSPSSHALLSNNLVAPASKNVVLDKSVPLKGWRKAAVIAAKVALVTFASIAVAAAVAAAIIFFGFPALAVTIGLSATLAITAMAVGTVSLLILLGIYIRNNLKASAKEQDKEASVVEPDVEKEITVEPVVTKTDAEMIQEALGVDVKKADYEEAFLKEHEVAYKEIMDAAIAEMAKVRKEMSRVPEADQKAVSEEGFEKPGLDQWKFAIEMDDKKNITQLFIGKFKAEGASTEVYFTPQDVILVPKEDEHGRSEKALLNAWEKINYLWESNDKLLKSNDPIKAIKAIDPDLLPPLPRKVTSSIGTGMMVAPKATPVADMFKLAPANTQEIVDRLKILRDVAKGVAFAHEVRLIHGDIKPDNMLISSGKKGQMHDFGGSYTINNKKDVQRWREEDSTCSPDYTHRNDAGYSHALKQMGCAKEEALALGKAQDVFALGLSTVEALLGITDPNDPNKLLSPVKSKFYKEFESTRYFAGSASDIKPCTIPVPAANTMLQGLLRKALDEVYQTRISAKEFAEKLDQIIRTLEQTEKLEIT